MKIIDMQIDDDGELGVYNISFVEKPAIESNWIYLNSNEIKLQSIDLERRMVYGAALIPDKEIYRVDDKGNEFYIRFSKEVIQKTAHRFFMQKRNDSATYEHQIDVKGVDFVESWIKEGDSDKSVHLGIDVPINTWLVGAYISNDALWERIKSGEVKGFSIEGNYANSISPEMELSFLIREFEEMLNDVE
jgi:hypothetical protein